VKYDLCAKRPKTNDQRLTITTIKQKGPPRMRKAFSVCVKISVRHGRCRFGLNRSEEGLHSAVMPAITEIDH
jgi:hypothetical protein